RKLRHELLAPRFVRGGVRRHHRVVEGRKRAGREEQGERQEPSAKLHGTSFVCGQRLEMKDQGGGAAGTDMAAAGRPECGRMTAAMRAACVLSRRRTGTPAAASSRMSAPDSSTLARNASQTASPT